MCLNKNYPIVPKQALINGTWQGIIPEVLRFQSVDFPEGLNMVEMSMICLYCPLSYMTMLSSGAHFIILFNEHTYIYVEVRTGRFVLVISPKDVNKNYEKYSVLIVSPEYFFTHAQVPHTELSNSPLRL